jgi:hypothetical protein
MGLLWMRGNTVAHTRKCLASAAIAAVENFRDAEGPDEYFLTGLESIRATAEGYLADGIATCQCERTRQGELITGIYKDRHTGEMAVTTESGIIYRDTPHS